MKARVAIIMTVAVALIVAAFFIPSIPQSEAYHHFADTRTFLHIPNCLNVLSNAIFLFVGAAGVRFVLRGPSNATHFVDPAERWPWLVFFGAVFLTAFGSGYYHLNPNNQTLVWDRLPMAIGFMALLAAVLAERIGVKTSISLLVPLILLGAGSVAYWSFTEMAGRGDLRPYALVQFGSLPILLLLLVLFPARYTYGFDFAVSLAIYAGAKIFESADAWIFVLGHVVSGHTVKHLVAGLSTWWLWHMLERRAPARGRDVRLAAQLDREE